MNDYERIARIIRYLDQNQADQPDLDDLAEQCGLSRFHFHRLFRRWAGVTPKDFLQCLTVEHARARLRQGNSVLDTALDAGLSSSGRLHDLCVTLEAATPGEIKSGSEGWIIEAGFTESPFGPCCVAHGPRGVCHLAFIESDSRESAAEPITRNWPRAQLRWNDARARKTGGEIFSTMHSSSARVALRAYVQATPFQIRVWRALLRIPSGALTSYGNLACAVGNPAAARAVGTAAGHNPIAFLIPCHRVIRETGIIGQYRWGHDRKRAMLGWEGARQGTIL
jgi:AraC family transcriptional regulator, regulatory protein of adaptative response / methylated-DNA-[protein]-cysteine methyltransferase